LRLERLGKLKSLIGGDSHLAHPEYKPETLSARIKSEMQNSLSRVFWAVTPCNSERARRFGELLRLKSKPGKKPAEEDGKLASTLKMEEIFLSKRRAVSKIHGFRTQKTVPFSAKPVSSQIQQR
jgi:hypothetical protein